MSSRIEVSRAIMRYEFMIGGYTSAGRQKMYQEDSGELEALAKIYFDKKTKGIVIRKPAERRDE